MKTKLKLHFLLLLTVLSVSHLAPAQGTAIGYQGRLNDGGTPATGLYDFTFSVYDADLAGALLAGPLALDAVSVTNGLFNVPLDFGPGIFTGPARWLEISVRSNGLVDLNLLTPRTPLLPTPYSIFAARAASLPNGTVAADQLNTPGAPPTAGQFLSYNGGNLIWTDPAVVAGNIWSRNGADTYYNAGKVGIGTSTPANPLTIRTPTLGYGMEHTDGDIRLSTFVGRGKGYLGTLSNHKLTFFVNNNGFDNMTMTLDTAGAVGMGTGSPTPGYRLEVVGATRLTPGNGAINFGSPNGELGMAILPTLGGGNSRADLRFDGSTLKLVAGTGGVGPPPSENGLVVSTLGNVGIGVAPANLAANVKLDVRSVNGFAVVGRSGFEGIHGESTHTSAAAVAGFNLSTGPGVYGVSQGGGYGGYFVGKVRVGILEIAGGADLAEPFPMKEEKLEKGSVVVIDDEHPGRLKRSTRAYDTRVAGIISGANGVNPGISLKQEGALDQGENVALTGRVYVQADASDG